MPNQEQAILTRIGLQFLNGQCSSRIRQKRSRFDNIDLGIESLDSNSGGVHGPPEWTAQYSGDPDTRFAGHFHHASHVADTLPRQLPFAVGDPWPARLRLTVA